MIPLNTFGTFAVADLRLEYHFVGPQPDLAPTLVLLHEGLGSAMQWGPLPEILVEKTGCGVLAFSRQGYGASSPVPLPRRTDFLEHEACTILPQVLDLAGLRSGLLIGHSDGASIAALALAEGDTRVRGGVLIAPHFRRGGDAGRGPTGPGRLRQWRSEGPSRPSAYRRRGSLSRLERRLVGSGSARMDNRDSPYAMDRPGNHHPGDKGCLRN